MAIGGEGRKGYRPVGIGWYQEGDDDFHYLDDNGQERTKPRSEIPGEELDPNRATPNTGGYGHNQIPQAGYDPNKYYLGGSEDFANNYARRFGDMSNQADTRTAPVTDYALANRMRAEQLGGMGLLRSAAHGGQPSAAEYGFQQNMNQAGANLGAGLAGGGSPLAQANAMRGGLYAGSRGAMAGAVQSSGERSGEEQRAIGAYTQGAMGMQRQDIGQAQYDADLQRRNQLLNDQRALALAEMESRAYESQRGALLRGQGALAGYQQRMTGLNRQRLDAANEKRRRDYETGYGAAAGAMTAGMGAYGASQRKPPP